MKLSIESERIAAMLMIEAFRDRSLFQAVSLDSNRVALRLGLTQAQVDTCLLEIDKVIDTTPSDSGMLVSRLDPPVGGVGVNWAPDGVPKS